MNPEDRCALPAHRGVGPENGIAFLIYRGREIPLEISNPRGFTKDGRIAKILIVLYLRYAVSFVRASKVALIDRDRVMDSVKRVNRE